MIWSNIGYYDWYWIVNTWSGAPSVHRHKTSATVTTHKDMLHPHFTVYRTFMDLDSILFRHVQWESRLLRYQLVLIIYFILHEDVIICEAMLCDQSLFSTGIIHSLAGYGCFPCNYHHTYCGARQKILMDHPPLHLPSLPMLPLLNPQLFHSYWLDYWFYTSIEKRSHQAG